MYYIFNDPFSFLLLVILFVVAFTKIGNLKKRLSILEKKALFDFDKVSAVSQPIVSANQSIGVQEPVVVTSSVKVPPTESSFVSWLKDDWLLKLGGLLLLIGFGWLTTYAFVNNWIGPMGRITLGIVVGVLILALGSWRIKKFVNQGGIFLVIGSSLILLTVFAAREIYDMFTPLTALVLMFLSTAYISLVSVKYNSFAVSLSGLVLAFIAPILTNITRIDEMSLLSYLMVITLGTIWIVAIKNNWGSLIFASLIGVSFYSMSVANSSLLWFGYAFAAVFFLASIFNIIKSKETDLKAFLWTAVCNGAFLLGWIISFVPTEWQSLVIALWMVIFAVGAFLAFNITKIKSVFLTYAGVAIAMLLIATAIEFEGEVSIIAFTLESFLIPTLIYYVTRDIRSSAVWSILFAWPVFLSLGNLDSYQSSKNVFSNDFFVMLIIIVALMALGLMYRKIQKAGEYSNFNPTNIFLVGGSIYAYFLLWSALHVGITEGVVATTLSLVIFTIIALVKYFYGLSVGSKVLRNYGAILIGLVILRLLFIDIWEMELGARIFVFILVGVLLMSTAFVSRRIKFSSANIINN